MHIEAGVLVHVELEDDDYDVISPLSFKVGMNNLMISLKMQEDLTLILMMSKMC